MIKKRIAVSVIILLFANAGIAFAEQICTEIKVGEDLGWHFYQEPKIVCHEVQKPTQTPAEKPKPEPVKEPEKPKKIETAIVQPKVPMGTAWLRENMQKYLDLAIDEPTEDNIRVYYALQQMAFDRADTFARKSQQVVMGDPYHDQEGRRSATTFGGQQLDAEAVAVRKKLLEQIKKKSGLFFFFDSQCSFCKRQAPIIRMLKERENHSIISASINGSGFDGDILPNWVPDMGHSTKLGVQRVPALVMVTPNSKKEFIPIQQGGVLAAEEIENRMIVAALAAGIVSEYDVISSRGIHNDYKHNVDKIFREHPELIKQHKGGFIPPSILDSYLKQD